MDKITRLNLSIVYLTFIKDAPESMRHDSIRQSRIGRICELLKRMKKNEILGEMLELARTSEDEKMENAFGDLFNGIISRWEMVPSGYKFNTHMERHFDPAQKFCEEKLGWMKS